MFPLRSTALSAAIIAGLLWQPGMAIADCGAYTTQYAAQQVLRADPTDPEGLDADGNGIACEDNPAPFDRVPVLRPFVPNTQPQDSGNGGSTDDESPSSAAPGEPTATPAPRHPYLGPVPPPLAYLQGGNGGAYPPGVSVTGTVIQPPNAGDGGLAR